MATKARKAKAAEKLSAWDPANHLKTEAEIAGYLAEIFEVAGDDSAVIAAALGDAAKAFGMVKLAKATGLTREGLYKALSKDGNPSFGTVLKVARALGVRLTVQAA